MLYFVPTPIGNLSDISYRALEVLQVCELIFCEDVRVCKALLNLLSSKYNIEFNINNFISLHSHNEKDFDFSKIDFSKNIAYLSDAGMPCISDPGISLVNYAQENDIKYSVLPGANAAITALVASGFSDKEFIFLGFLNIKKNRQAQIENALNQSYPTIIYEAPTRILDLVLDIAKIDEDKELFLIKEISKMYEKTYKNTAKNLANILKNENLKGEWVVVINNENSISNSNINSQDILNLNISLKDKAKLLSKLNGLSPKQNYENLLKSEK
ncbi:16S rRNA (cytidine(1402)-2'-O)-methyltransferase [Campylobacter sp. 2018MI13]|uniref:16S rRNA (cytidine(1402)-2'-O)-methyltransferase n=1 Tax=Campylobacter sp. 2018MI13 TaxID=2836737 RepID=UPI001BDABA88|nr:16S rRNA (cytidine(1402)-2'-O)-methyltransferase [Campylobacter sp. 2018MI13]MBT0882231.1 16S rRNA (cytidine(1402)-2'-O)-methyltransferase [Campylobacter sp. 2018MI13]